MSTQNQIGIIELGNLDLKCIIFKISDDNKFEILSSASAPSEGIYNGIVVNLDKASSSIRSCVSKAEKKANLLLKKISVILEQPDFLCTKFSKHKKIDGSKIYKEDIDFLLKEAKKQLLLNDTNQSIIHIFNHNYIVDGKNFLEEPMGVYADTLSHEMTFITMPKNNLKNINQAFLDCDLEIERFISNTFSLGVQLLDDKELKFGSILIDIGLESISLGLFRNLALVHSVTLPYGLSYIAKDISKVCLLSMEESKFIRDGFDFSFKNNQHLFDEQNYLKKDFFNNSSFRKISKDLILSVIKDRLDEIFKKIKKQIIVPGFEINSGVKVLLTGEGSNLINIENYCKIFFGSNVIKKSKDEKIEIEDNNFTSCFGAFKIIKEGWETEALPEIHKENIKKTGLFQKIFKNFT